MPGIDRHAVEIEVWLKFRCGSVAIEFGSRCCAVGVFVGRPISFAPLVCVHHVQTALISLQGECSIECYTAFAFFCAPGRDDDYTVGRLSAIYRSGCGIFEYLNGFNIIAVKNCTGIFTGHHSVYHIERTVGISTERGCASD